MNQNRKKKMKREDEKRRDTIKRNKGIDEKKNEQNKIYLWEFDGIEFRVHNKTGQDNQQFWIIS